MGKIVCPYHQWAYARDGKLLACRGMQEELDKAQFSLIPVLDGPTYADLVKPSSAVAPFTYRAVAPDLFTDIVSSVMQPNVPARLTYSASQRVEK